jgi:putative heme-binding domain-containing protein
LEQRHTGVTGFGHNHTTALPNLKHDDRFIRYAARISLEHEQAVNWRKTVLSADDADTLIGGCIALARHTDKTEQSDLLNALNKLDFDKLDERRQLDLLRAYQLVFTRTGPPSKEAGESLVKKLDPLFPHKSDNVNRELAQLLVYLKSPTIVEKVTAEMAKPSKPLTLEGLDELILRNRGYGGSVASVIKNAADQQKLSYLFTLRNATVGWNLERWKVWYGFLAEAQTKSGGASYQKFLVNIEKDAYANATDVDRLAIEAGKLRPAYKAKELPKPTGPGKEWTTADLTALEAKLKSGRNFKNGEKAYAAARCVVCHRFGTDGGATGPDLTQLAGRFALKDLAEAIVEPSKVISDQYKAAVIETKGGKTITGRIVSEVGGKYVVVTDPEDSTKVTEVTKGDIDTNKPSATSLMPGKLIDPLNEAEVLDLLAYLLSRGDPTHPAFKK